MRLKIILFILYASLAYGQPISWSQRTTTVSGFAVRAAAAFSGALPDPVSGQFITNWITTSISANTLYGDSWAAYCPPGVGGCTTDQITLMNQTATTVSPGGSSCSVADATHWGNSHSYRGMWIDSVRSPNRQYLMGGAESACTGTGINANPRAQMFHWALNSNPSTDTGVTQDTPTHLPWNAANSNEIHTAHDTTADVFVSFFGGPPTQSLTTNMYIYCPGVSLSAAQTNWGCTANADWQFIFPVNGGYTFSGNTVTVTSGSASDVAVNDFVQFGTSNWTPGATNGPSVSAVVTTVSAGSFTVASASGTIPATGFWTLYPSGQDVGGTERYYEWGTKLFFDAGGGAHGRILVFGGFSAAGNLAIPGTFVYDGQAHHWIHLGQNTIAPTLPDSTAQYPFSQIATAFDSVNRKLWYRVACPHTTVANSCSGTPADYEYDAAGDTWVLVDSGAGPAASGVFMEYQSTCTCLMTIDMSTGTIWVGVVQNTVNGQFRTMATWPDGHLKHVEGCGVLASLTGGSLASITVNGVIGGAYTIQEQLYPGDQTGSTYTAGGATNAVGLSRTNEPFCTDIPIADSASLLNTSTLSFTGTVNVTNTNLATNNQDCTGASNTNFICVNTGAAKFQIRKANTNIIDAVTIGASTIVASGTAATRGLILTGPDPSLAYPGNTTCAGGVGCTVQYSSANDAGSTCTISVNGPVKALIRCVGSLIDGASHVYMHHLTYLLFYVNEPYVIPEIALRNADFGVTTGDISTATKQLASFELRLPLSGSPTTFTIYSFSGDTNCTMSACTGTTAGASGAFLYQGYSNFLSGLAGGGGWTADVGFTIQNNGAQITNGNATKVPAGSADCANGSGLGAAVGIFNIAAKWPSSVECVSSDIRIGFYSSHNGIISSTVKQPYVPWPQWTVFKGFAEFHTSAPSSTKNDFLKAQLRLVGRPSVAYFNNSGVETYPIATATESDNLSVAAFTASIPALGGHPTEAEICGIGSPPCMIEYNATGINPNYPLQDYRFWGWGGTGAATDLDARRANSMNFISRGYTGRQLDSEMFYNWEMSYAWPHSDGANSTDSTVNSFLWNTKPGLDSLGRPSATFYISANQGTWYSSISPQTDPNWWDDLHFWWGGVINNYFWTGDELLREALVSTKAWYLNTGAIQNSLAGMNGGTTRGNAAQIMSASQMAEFFSSIGDADGATILANAKTNFENWVLPDSCIQDGAANLWPPGCTFPTINGSANNTDSRGVSHVRGSMIGSSLRASNILYCDNTAWGGTSTGVRVDVPYFDSKMIDALITLQRVAGTGYTHYWDINDLAYGISQNSLGPSGYSDNGTANWWVAPNSAPVGPANSLFNGFRFSPAIDVPYQCSNNPTPAFNYSTPPFFDVESFTVPGGVWDINELAVGFGGPNPVGSRASVFGSFLGMVHTNGALTGDQVRKLYIPIQAQSVANGQNTVDHYSYQFGALAHYLAVSNPAKLRDIPFTILDLGSCGAGCEQYRVTVTLPASTTQVRIKYSPKTITNSGGFSSISPAAANPADGMLGYEPTVTQLFNLSPTTNATWFASTDVTPATFTPGALNNFMVNTTLGAGAALSQFSVKALFIIPGTPSFIMTGTVDTGTVVF